MEQHLISLNDETNSLIKELIEGASKPNFSVPFKNSLQNDGICQSNPVVQMLLEFVNYIDRKIDNLYQCANGNNLALEAEKLRELTYAALAVIELRSLNFCGENTTFSYFCLETYNKSVITVLNEVTDAQNSQQNPKKTHKRSLSEGDYAVPTQNKFAALEVEEPEINDAEVEDMSSDPPPLCPYCFAAGKPNSKC